jgi:lysophospholipase L1-like esterase
VAARSPGVRVVDFGDRLTPGGRLVRVIDGVTVRSSDGVHLTPEGGRWIAPWLAPQLVAAAPPVRPGGHR